MQTVWFVLLTCFPSGSVGFWCVLGSDQSPIKTLVLLWADILPLCSWTKSGPCDPSWGRGHKEAHRWIPLVSTCVFAPWDLDVYVYYTAVVDLSRECNPVLSSSDFLNMEVVLGDPPPTSQGSLLLNLLRNCRDYILKQFYLCSSHQHHTENLMHFWCCSVIFNILFQKVLRGRSLSCV